MSPALPPSAAPEHLFSYGTLQLEAVQLATFGRRLAGKADRLNGFRLERLAIRSDAVVATSGQAHHPIAVWTGRQEDGIDGTVLAVTAEELARADAYEVDDYRRDRVMLASGGMAWAYVDAREPAAPACEPAAGR